MSIDPIVAGADHIDVGSPYVLNLSANDTSGGPATVSSWNIDWGDGSDPDSDYTIGQLVSGTASTISHNYASAGSFTINASASDGTTWYAGHLQSLDSTFGTAGKVVTNLQGNRDMLEAIATTPDGHILAAGYSAGIYGSTPWQFGIVEYNADGSKNTSFGTNGIVLTRFGSYDDLAQALVVQPDGDSFKFYVAGYSNTTGGSSPYYDVAIARYNADGSLDTSWNGTGKVLSDAVGGKAGGYIEPHYMALALDADGKLLLTSGNNGSVVLTRYLTSGSSAGSLDTSFNSSGSVPGVVTTNLGGYYYGHSIGLQSDGKIVVGADASNSPYKIAAVRYNTNGTLDSGFGNGALVGGGATTGGGAWVGQFSSTSFLEGLVVRSDGKIVLGGIGYMPVPGTSTWAYQPALLRLSSAGVTDTTFGSSGVAKTYLGGGLSNAVGKFAMDANGNFVLAMPLTTGGSSPNTSDFLTARFTSAGALDTTFADGGVAISDFGYVDSSISLAFASNGDIIVAGVINKLDGAGEDFAIARYLPDSILRVNANIFDAQPASSTPSTSINITYQVPSDEPLELEVAGPADLNYRRVPVFSPGDPSTSHVFAATGLQPNSHYSFRLKTVKNGVTSFLYSFANTAPSSASLVAATDVPATASVSSGSVDVPFTWSPGTASSFTVTIKGYISSQPFNQTTQTFTIDSADYSSDDTYIVSPTITAHQDGLSLQISTADGESPWIAVGVQGESPSSGTAELSLTVAGNTGGTTTFSMGSASTATIYGITRTNQLEIIASLSGSSSVTVSNTSIPSDAVDAIAIAGGSFSNIVALPGASPVAPLSPTNLVVSPYFDTAGFARTALTWTNNSDNETNYLVQRQDLSDVASTWQTVITTGSDIRSAIDSPPLLSHVYSYRVLAANAGSVSSPSNSVLAWFAPLLSPISINSTAAIAGSPVTLSLSAAAEANQNHTLSYLWSLTNTTTESDPITFTTSAPRLEFTPIASGTWSANVRVTDTDLSVSSSAGPQTFTVVAAPAVQIVGSTFGIEGQVINYSEIGLTSDITWTVTGGATSITATGATLNFALPTSGDYTISVTGEDSEEVTQSASITLRVAHMQPTVMITGPVTAFMGKSVVFGSRIEPVPAISDTISYEWELLNADGSPYVDSTIPYSANLPTFLVPGSLNVNPYKVRLTVTDTHNSNSVELQQTFDFSVQTDPDSSLTDAPTGSFDWGTIPLESYGGAVGEEESNYGDYPELADSVQSHLQGIHAVVQQNDGKLIVAGRGTYDGNSPYAGPLGLIPVFIARLNQDLTLDTSFGADHTGIVNFTFVDSSLQELSDLFSLTINPINHDIVAVGVNVSNNGSTYLPALAVAEFVTSNTITADGQVVPAGSLDPAFNSGTPKVLTSATTASVGFTATVLKDGSILVGGTAKTAAYDTTDALISSYLDPSYGIDTSHVSLPDFLQVKFRPNGELDTSFNATGIAEAPAVTGLETYTPFGDSTPDLVITGPTNFFWDSAEGDISGWHAAIQNLIVLDDGDILAGGSAFRFPLNTFGEVDGSGTDGGFAMVRYGSDGSVISQTFTSSSTFNQDLYGVPDPDNVVYPATMAMLPNGNVLMAGTAGEWGSGDVHVVMAQYDISSRTSIDIGTVYGSSSATSINLNFDDTNFDHTSFDAWSGPWSRGEAGYSGDAHGSARKEGPGEDGWGAWTADALLGSMLFGQSPGAMMAVQADGTSDGQLVVLCPGLDGNSSPTQLRIDQIDIDSPSTYDQEQLPVSGIRNDQDSWFRPTAVLSTADGVLGIGWQADNNRNHITPWVFKSSPAPEPAAANLNVAAAQDSSVTLTWNNTGFGQDGYLIERASTAAGLTSSALIAIVGAGQQDYVDQRVAQDTTWYYRVIPFSTDSSGNPVEGTPSNVAVVHTLPTAAQVLQETLSVPLDGSAVTSTTVLESGKTYILVASGSDPINDAYGADSAYLSSVSDSGTDSPILPRINPYAIQSLTAVGTVATAMTAFAHGFLVGDQVYIKGADQSDYNGLFTITAATTTTFSFTVPSGTLATATGTNLSVQKLTAYDHNMVQEQTVEIDSLTSSGTTATATTPSTDGYAVGDLVYVYGADQSQYNGVFAITALTSTSFTFTVPSGTPSTATGSIEGERFISTMYGIGLNSGSPGDAPNEVPYWGVYDNVHHTYIYAVVGDGNPLTFMFHDGSNFTPTGQSLQLQIFTASTEPGSESSDPVQQIVSPQLVRNGALPPVISQNTPIDVISAAPDGSAVPWALWLQSPDQSWTLLASSNGSVGALPNQPASVFTLNPALYPNGDYKLDLTSSVTDPSDHIVDSASISIQTVAKVGNLVLPQTDAALNTPAGPISITRLYNSGRAGNMSGGWTLSLLDAQLTVTAQDDTYGPERIYHPMAFSSDYFTPGLKTPALRAGDLISLTVPDDGQHVFEFDPIPVNESMEYANNAAGIEYIPHFIAVDGSQATLTLGGILGNPVMSSGLLAYDPASNEFIDTSALGSSEPPAGFNPARLLMIDPGKYHNYNPDLGLPYNDNIYEFGGAYRLTTSDGSSYIINAASGLIEQVSNTSGNRITYDYSEQQQITATGSNGNTLLTINMDRDNRITSINVPGQEPIIYSYDISGNLSSVENQIGDRTLYSYQDPNNPALLTGVTNAQGQNVLQASYDLNGKLRTIVNSNGAVVPVLSSPLGQNESIQTTTNPNGDVVENVINEKYGTLDRTILRETDSSGNVLDYLVSMTSYEYVNEDISVMSALRHSGIDVLRSIKQYPTFEVSGSDAAGLRFTYQPAADSWTKRTIYDTATDISLDPAAQHVVSVSQPLTDDGILQTTRYGQYRVVYAPLDMAKPQVVTTVIQTPNESSPTGYDDVVQSIKVGDYDNLGNLQFSLDGIRPDPEHTGAFLAEGRYYRYGLLGKLTEIDLLSTYIYPDGTTGGLSAGAPITTNTYYTVSDAAGAMYGRLKTSTDAAGQETYYAYDSMGHTALQYVHEQWNDADGNTFSGWVGTTNVYNAFGQLTDTYQATYLDTPGETGNAHILRTSTIEQDEIGEPVIKTFHNDDGTTSSTPIYNLADDSGVLFRTLSDGSVQSDAVSSFGSTLSAEQPIHITRSVVDEVMNRIYSAPLHAVHFEYNPLGQKIKSVDQFGGVTLYTYDSQSHLIRTINPDGTETRSVFDPMGREIWKTDTFVPANSDPTNADNIAVATNTIYNQLGQVVEKDRYTDVAIEITNSKRGSIGVAESTAVGGTLVSSTLTKYDEQGRAIETIAPSGLRTGTIYYPDGSVQYSGILTDGTGAAPDGGHSTTFDGLITRAYELTDFDSYTETRANQLATVINMPAGAAEDDVLTLTLTDAQGENADSVTYTVTSDDAADPHLLGVHLAAAINAHRTGDDLYSQITASANGAGTVVLSPAEAWPQYQSSVTLTHDTTTSPQVSITYSQTTWTKDQNGHATLSVKDGKGRDVLAVYDDGTFTEMLFGIGNLAVPGHEVSGQSIAGHQETKVDQLGRATDYFYDLAGRLTDVWQPAVIDADPNSPTYGLDSSDSVHYLKPVRPHTTYVYDSAGNEIVQRTAGEQAAYAAWLALPQFTYTQEYYDWVDAGSEGEPVGIIEKDPFTNKTTFAYDQYGNMVHRTLPDDSVATPEVEKYTYDKFNRIAAHTDFKGQIAKYIYDDDPSLPLAEKLNLGRLVYKNYYASTTDAGNDNVGQQVHYTYDSLGRQYQVTDDSGTTTYYYDEFGNQTEAQTPEGTVDYSYDPATQLHTETIADDGETDILYTYDNQGRLSEVYTLFLNGSFHPFDTLYTYDAAGNTLSVASSDGTETDYTYDDLNRLTDVSDDKDGVALLSQHYTLLDNGDRASVDEVAKNPDGSAFSTTTINWTYDDDDRLTGEEYTSDISGRSYTDTFAYDLGNNRVDSAHTGSGGAETITSTYNDDDQLISQDASLSGTTTYTYDANGSQIEIVNGASDDVYVYDLRNKLVSATVNGVTSTYIYDDSGDRVEETIDGTPTVYLADKANPTGYDQTIEEKPSASAAPTTSYIIGDRIIAQADASGTISTLLVDGHGSTRFVVTASAAPVRMDYSAFGGAIGFDPLTTPTVHLFGGDAVLDRNTGLYIHGDGERERIGFRFIQADDLGYGNNRNPITLHKNLYADGNPISGHDPSGHMCALDLLGASFIGAGIEVGNAGATIIEGEEAKEFAEFEIVTYEEAVDAEIAADELGGEGMYELNVQFGNNPNQYYHTFRHVVGSGLDSGLVRQGVLNDAIANSSSIVPGSPFNGIIQLNGQTLEYTAYRLPSGVINIGRIDIL